MDFCRRQSCKGKVQEKELQKADKSGEEGRMGRRDRREETRAVSQCLADQKSINRMFKSAMTGTNSAAKLKAQT